MANALTSLALQVLIIETDLLRHANYDAKLRPAIDDFQLVTFEQIWPSTALGFGGIGGQTLTKARTYVFIPSIQDQPCIVYFGSQFAYTVPYSARFMQDCRGQSMASCAQRGRYLNAAKANSN